MVLAHERCVSLWILVSLLCLGLFAQGCAVDPNRVKNPAEQAKHDAGQGPSTETIGMNLISSPSADMPELPLEWSVLRQGRTVNAAGRRPSLAVATVPKVQVEIAMVARVNGRPVTPGQGNSGGVSSTIVSSDALGRVSVDIASFLRELPEAPSEIEIRATIPGPPVSSQTVTLNAAM
jgi:hypothetical protein